MHYKNIKLVLVVLTITACASAPQQTADVELPVYPPPPEPPRFYFERTIFGSADVEIVDKETKWRRALTGEATTTVAFSKPFDVEVCQGIVFVSDSVGRQVLVFDVPNGEFRQIGTKEPGTLRKPLGIATDEDCNLYVADQTGKRIVQYDQGGQYMNAYGGKDMFDRLTHVAVDASGDRLYAVDTGGVRSERHHIRVIDTNSGDLLFDIGKRGSGDGELNLPLDIEIGPDGNLHIVDGGNFRIQTFDLQGNYVGQFGRIGNRTGQFSRPKGMDIDSAGNIYVTDAAFGNFQIFDSDGQLLLFVGDRSASVGPGKFMLPAGLAVDEDGRVYMVDQFFRKVDVFRPAGIEAHEGYLGTRAGAPK
jgi:DNA-binding beta-propeller fold protein YncE